jgi:peptide deformylase
LPIHGDFALKPLFGQRLPGRVRVTAGKSSENNDILKPCVTDRSLHLLSERFPQLKNTMALLPILCYPDPRLHTVAKPVQAVDARIQTLIVNMLETMYEAKGIGLAATQVDLHERLIVIDVSEQRDQPLVLINPQVIQTSVETHLNEEGCLSVPGIYDGVERFDSVTVTAMDGHGKSRVVEAEDLLAVCIQHEMDHLMGKVFVEYLSPLKRNRIRKKMLKAQREEQR